MSDLRKPYVSLAISALIISALPLSAIDLDGDGIDDLYVARFGVSGADPESDQDRDGFSLRTESLFETNPNDSADRPTLRLEAGEDLQISWPTKSGVGYVLQESEDLTSWSPVSPLLLGSGLDFGQQVGLRNRPSFFRISATPLDSDQDGLRDVDEATLGSDPLNSDTDGDGLGDGFEAAEPALDPLVPNDPCLDHDENGRPDLEDLAASLGTSVISWLGPPHGDWHQASNWSGGQLPDEDSFVLLAPCAPNGPTVTISTDAQAAAIVGTGSLHIDGGTLELGSHLTLTALALMNGGTLSPLAESYVKLDLTLSSDLTIDATSTLEVDNAGYPPREGPGSPLAVQRAGTSASGGSHGGRGGRGRFAREEELGRSYGSILHPSTFGSASNRRNGPGGGALRIKVGGTLQVDGSLRADAIRRTAAGAGGSIWIDCGTLDGEGTISVVGANGNSGAGAGGGGRIAVYYDTTTFTGTFDAQSGENGNPGGAGSVFTKGTAAALGTLTFANGGIEGNVIDGITPIHPNQLKVDANLIVRDGAIVTSVPEETLHIATPGTISIEANSAIDVTGQGFPGGSGPGVAREVRNPGTGPIGASHGGEGGFGRLLNDRTFLGAVYGSITEPVDFGSGSNRSEPAGGGALRIECQSLTNNGILAADGDSGAGGGAGGSIWITCSTLSGEGLIRANGGAPSENAGGGGGGRIAIYYDSDETFQGEIKACGLPGITNRPGGAGSIYLRQSGALRPLLRFDNGGTDGALTPMLESKLDLEVDLEVVGKARLTNLLGQQLQIEIPGSLTVGPEGSIDVSARGHDKFQGPGASTPPNPTQMANGASHASPGGHGWRVDPQPYSSTYGSIQSPTSAGSGAASWGGGVLRLISGELTIDGEIRADGGEIQSPRSSGSGGSIWITCTNLGGTGTIAANGGEILGPQVQLGGGGSGGRIAVSSTSSSFTGSYEAASPVVNASGAGTIYLDHGGITSLLIDNGGTTADEPTLLPRLTELTGEFIVRGKASVSRVPDSIDPVLEVVAQGGIEIAADSALDYSSLPLGTQLENSIDLPELKDEPTYYGGASHGGNGGYEIYPLQGDRPGSYAYDSAYNPRMPGTGQRAGGVIILSSEGELRLEGTIAADAGDAPRLTLADATGSSGGSILLSAPTILGSGTLSAQGGRANSTSPDRVFGGGAGGRIALYGISVSDQFTIQLKGGLGNAFALGQNLDGAPGDDGSFLHACFPLNPTTGALKEIAPPSDLRLDQLESATEIFMFPEHLTFLYANPDESTESIFEAVAPGTYDAASDLQDTPLENKVWTTYLLHADPPASSAPVLTASITFSQDIVGVIATREGIDNTNRWLGSQVPVTGGVFTASDGLELDQGDSFTISPDRQTLTVTFNTADGLDQLRVVTRRRGLGSWCPQS